MQQILDLRRLLGHLNFLDIAVALLVFGAAQTALADITIAVVPESQTVTLGSTADVAVQIAGLGNLTAPSLGTFDINLGFDPTLLSFNGATFGDPILGDQLDPLGMGNTISLVTPGPDSVDLFELSLDSPDDLNNLQAPSFILASVSFDAVGIGSSSMDLSINALGDADGNALSATIQSGSIDVSGVTAVPEPAAFSLLATILVALVARLQMFKAGRNRRESA